jgi:hypothetical protein
MPLSRANAPSKDGGMNRDPRSVFAIQIVDNPQHPEQLIARRVRRRDRALARLFASSLDTQLAAGRAPESTRLLATRAQQLASGRMRRELARDVERVLGLVHREGPSRRVLVSRKSIVDVEPDLREMLAKLATPLPTSARGVAMVRVLLTDGTGPLFNRHSSTNLRNAIHDAIAQLDSAGSADVLARTL